MRNNKRVHEATQHKLLLMDLTHKLCKTDLINTNDIQLLSTSKNFQCHVEYNIAFTPNVKLS